MVTDDALRLAGYTLAHAAWSVEDGEMLCTLAIASVGRSRKLFRYEYESGLIPDSVVMARSLLSDLLGADDFAALAYDGFVTFEGERTDALIIAVLGAGGLFHGEIAQRYRPTRDVGLATLGRAQVFGIIGQPLIERSIGRADAEGIVMQGVSEHPEGPRIFHTRRN